MISLSSASHHPAPHVINLGNPSPNPTPQLVNNSPHPPRKPQASSADEQRSKRTRKTKTGPCLLSHHSARRLTSILTERVNSSIPPPQLSSGSSSYQAQGSGREAHWLNFTSSLREGKPSLSSPSNAMDLRPLPKRDRRRRPVNMDTGA